MKTPKEILDVVQNGMDQLPLSKHAHIMIANLINQLNEQLAEPEKETEPTE